MYILNNTSTSKVALYLVYIIIIIYRVRAIVFLARYIIRVMSIKVSTLLVPVYTVYNCDGIVYIVACRIFSGTPQFLFFAWST